MTAATTPTYLLYSLTLHSPAIVSTLSGDPNGAVTQPFIPGSAIRGAVAARLLATQVAGDSEEFRSLVLSGAVRYLHAYPEIAAARALPVPLSWRSEKDDVDCACDLAAYDGQITEKDDAEDFGQIWPEESLVSVCKPFSAPTSSAGARTLAMPHIDARLHQQRDRVKGRPWTDKQDGQEIPRGRIFPYEYLEAGQVFRGAIQVMAPAREHIERIKTLLTQPILIGRSRRAGYGGEAEISFTADVNTEYENVSGSLSKDVSNGQCFRVMLTSAYIGHHPSTGQIDPLALDHELFDRLDGNVTVERRRWGFETMGGFNQKWRLEVQQVQAAAPGSVLVLKAAQPIPVTRLREIEHEGLGQRRVEGFGRVLFLEHSKDAETICLNRKPEKPAGQQSTGALLSDAQMQKQLEFLEERIVLAAAKAELDRLGADMARDGKRIPTSSLLGRVRTVFRGVHDETTARSALGTLMIWCSDNDGDPKALKKNARKKLRDCSLGQNNLMQWLQALSRFEHDEEEKARWDRLVAATVNASTLTGLAQSYHLTDKSLAERRLKQNAALLSVHLIDTVLAALARRNRGGRQ